MIRIHALTLSLLCLLPMIALAQTEIPTGGTATSELLVGATRVKDIARVQGARENQLLGYGLVVGLNGTGDGSQTEFTVLALGNMLQRLGLTVDASRLRAKNVATVMVTADIGPFLSSGDRIDVAVSSLGDAKSLQGGMLLQTPLFGADGKVYAVAQGSISLGGFSAESAGSSETSGHPTAGRVPAGALVEAEIPMSIAERQTVTFSLNAPDFTTAARMTEAINAQYPGAATARDAASVDVRVPADYSDHLVEFVATVGQVAVVPDAVARVVINERTGTVVVGGNVTITPVAVAQGNLTVSIDAGLAISQPAPFSGGETVVEPVADVRAEETPASLVPVSGHTVEELVRSLNAMKVSPRDMIAILQALKKAGALQAELRII